MKRSYAKTWKILYMFCLRLYLFLRTHPDDWFFTFIDWYRVHFYPSTFSATVFFQKFSFLTVYLVQGLRWVASITHRRKIFWNLGLQIAGKCIFLGFPWNFRVLWAVLKKNWLERYIQLSSMRIRKLLNQRVREIGEQNGKFFQKQKKKETHEENRL